MRRLRRAYAALVAFAGEREPAEGLALFRIAVGLVMLYALLSMVVPGLDHLLWIDAADGGMQRLRGDHWLLELLGGPTGAVMGALIPTGILLAVLVAAGAGGRVTLLLAGQVYAAIVRANPTIIGGYDHLLTNALWLLFLGGATASLSVDARLRRGAWRPADATVAAWPRRLAVFQLLVVYTTTGINKLGVPWTPIGGFSALYWVYQEPTWRRFDMSWTADPLPYVLLQIAAAVTWIWEIGAIILLLFFYFRATPERPGRLRALAQRFDLRAGFIAVGVVLHVGILLTLNVGPFSWISLAYYLCFFRPEELVSAVRRLRRRPVTGAPDGDERAPRA
ncbi:MAG: HTTM domain-containing protein [Myxococcales bacterium]|nr:HTTM domain-containing protein [Myxococcales bacterium]